MSGSEGGIESIIRRIVREEFERSAAASPSPSVPAADDRKLLYSVADVAAATGMSAQYVRNVIRSGQLKASQPSGTKYLLDREIAVRYAAWLRSGRP
jgi:excisionase family DNA binding protein